MVLLILRALNVENRWLRAKERGGPVTLFEPGTEATDQGFARCSTDGGTVPCMPVCRGCGGSESAPRAVSGNDGRVGARPGGGGPLLHRRGCDAAADIEDGAQAPLIARGRSTPFHVRAVGEKPAGPGQCATRNSSRRPGRILVMSATKPGIVPAT